ncbi:hypothetical protein ABIE26_004457 [Pedobacter africanus]|uniref:Uncharacterized protein n=1 Tax=Pedobacter africanus TaxID=151894 RepID=A0ACC6L340_9SPHI|nr:hypothetical protein [Pedobacter africanus]MDR6786073.1 hypothetical protein [Pedobacter africanus]
MKKILVLLSLTAVFFLQACEKKGPGDNYDFSNSLPPYVALSNTTAKTVKEGANATFTFQVKTSLQQTVTVTYKVEGAINSGTKTVVISRDALSADAVVAVPVGTIVAPATTATATLTLVSATKADGTAMTIGSKNDAATQKVTINITK